MAAQVSIDGRSRRREGCGEEKPHVKAVAWFVARIVIAAGSIRQAAGRAFKRIKIVQERGDRRKQMKLVESLALGNRRQLLLVICNNQKYLVGAGADNVGSILAIEAETASHDRAARGPELVRRRGREANQEARSKAAAEARLDLWH